VKGYKANRLSQTESCMCVTALKWDALKKTLRVKWHIRNISV